MNKADTVDKSIEILKWAIKNNKSQALACKQFEVNPDYVRNTRTKRKKHERYSELVELYEKLILKSLSSTSSTEQSDEILDREFIVEEEKTSFIQDAQGKGILDARGNRSIKTLEQLLEESKVDLRIWEVERCLPNIWTVTNAQGQTYQNWQIKAWLRRKEGIEDAIKFDDFFKELLENHDPYKYQKVEYEKKKKQEKNLLEINIYDLHLGKLCWSEEVENNYDTKIASSRFNYALHKLVERAMAFDFERILFTVGNDFFNSDGHLNQTTLGTRQDEDSRWQKTFKTGERLVIEAIDYLRTFAPVEVKVIPGNHDWTKSFFLGEVLCAWYKSDKCVTIDNSANPRKYFEYGNLLLGLTHGNNEKPEALRSLMSFEAKEAWARTCYKEFHVGHQHRKLSYAYVVKSNMIHEELGLTIRHMSSLAGTDAWHHTMSYVGPTRAAEAFLWNYETGLVCNFNVNIDLKEKYETDDRKSSNL